MGSRTTHQPSAAWIAAAPDQRSWPAWLNHDGPAHSRRLEPGRLDGDLVERLNGRAIRRRRRRDGDVEITAIAGFHVTHDPPRGGRGHRPVRVDAVNSHPNIRDSPREAVVDVPRDPSPRGPSACASSNRNGVGASAVGVCARATPAPAIVVIVIANSNNIFFISDSPRQRSETRG